MVTHKSLCCVVVVSVLQLGFDPWDHTMPHGTTHTTLKGSYKYFMSQEGEDQTNIDWTR